MSDCRFMMNVKGIGMALIPRIFFQRKLKNIFSDILKYDAKNLAYISERVRYYNKINSDFSKDLQVCGEKEKIGKLPFKKLLWLMMDIRLVNILKMIFYG